MNRHTTVSPYDFDMLCEYEYITPEHPIMDSPGAVLITCRVGGVDVMDMLTSAQIERIEGAILDTLKE